MRRLVADLLLLARADTGRRPPPRDSTSPRWSRRPRRSSSRWPAATRSPSTRRAGVRSTGTRDELHRLALNLIENALRHTDPGTAVEASVERDGRRGRALRRGRRPRRAARARTSRCSSASCAAPATAAAPRAWAWRSCAPWPSPTAAASARAAARRPRRALRRAPAGGDRRRAGAARGTRAGSAGRDLSPGSSARRFCRSFGRPCVYRKSSHVRHHLPAARRLLSRSRGVRAADHAVQEIIRYTEPRAVASEAAGSAASSACAARSSRSATWPLGMGLST